MTRSSFGSQTKAYTFSANAILYETSFGGTPLNEVFMNIWEWYANIHESLYLQKILKKDEYKIINYHFALYTPFSIL